MTVSEFHLSDRSTLRPDDGVGIIVLDGEGRYLLQLRDDKAGIFFPGHWGCFGGAVDPGETAEQALVREFREELGVVAALGAFHRFSHYTFDMGFAGCGTIYRTFYEIQLSAAEISGLRLGEGSDMNWFDACGVLSGIPLTPYDGFALWMHINRGRLQPPKLKSAFVGGE